MLDKELAHRARHASGYGRVIARSWNAYIAGLDSEHQIVIMEQAGLGRTI